MKTVTLLALGALFVTGIADADAAGYRKGGRMMSMTPSHKMMMGDRMGGRMMAHGMHMRNEGAQNLYYYYGGPCPCPVERTCPPEPCSVVETCPKGPCDPAPCPVAKAECPPEPCPPKPCPVVCCPEYKGIFSDCVDRWFGRRC